MTAKKMTESEFETLAQLVKRLRLSKKFTLKQVKKNSGDQISDGYISLIENGVEDNPSVDKLIALANGLQVPLSTLTGALTQAEPSLDRDQLIVISSMEHMDRRARVDVVNLARQMALLRPKPTEEIYVPTVNDLAPVSPAEAATQIQSRRKKKL